MTRTEDLAAPAGIAFRAVSRRFQSSLVLADVSLDVPRGSIMAVLGASGSGKSTLLRLAAGLERVDAGAILFDNEVMSSRERHVPPEARRIGLVFQDFALFPHLTLEANVAFGLAEKPRIERQSIARTWLERVGLADRARDFPHELSGGEQQRVSLARALAPGPRAILLDEPFSGLDPTLRADLRDRSLGLIRDAGATAIFVTHDADDAMLTADAITVLHAGRVMQTGAPRQVYAQPRSVIAARALGPLNEMTAVVHNERCATPWGDVPAPGLKDGAVVLAVRPEHVVVTPGGEARIVERRPLGALDRLTIALNAARWTATCPPNAAFAPGDSVTVSAATNDVLLFSKHDA